MSIMNRINKISQLLRSGLWATAMLMCVTACTDNEIVYKTGQNLTRKHWKRFPAHCAVRNRSAIGFPST